MNYIVGFDIVGTNEKYDYNIGMTDNDVADKYFNVYQFGHYTIKKNCWHGI